MNIQQISQPPLSPLPSATPVEALVPPAPHQAVAVSPPSENCNADLRAAGDAQVATSFAKTLSSGPAKNWVQQPRVDIHPDSTLGRWYLQLDDAFMDPGFREWVQEQQLEQTTLTFIPSQGQVRGYVNGQLKTFCASDDSGWADISRTLMSILKRFAPEPGQEVRFPWYGREGQIPAPIVTQFYGEPINPTPAQAATRVRQIRENPSFRMPDSYVSARSEEALSTQAQTLGDDANRHAMVTALKSQVDDVNGRIDLDKVQIPIDPRSALFKSTQRSSMSLAQLLQSDGTKVPTNSEQALGVAMALSFDLAHRAPGAASGGVMPTASSLGATALRRMNTQVKQWMAQRASQPPPSQADPVTATLLSRLLGNLPESTRIAIRDNPSVALDQLIRSPEALELGKKIQAALKIIDTPTSAIESVGAALVQELDPGVGKSQFNLAGYNLYSLDNTGASHGEIVRRFTQHLEGTVGVEGAPIAARLLLTAAAPEFLVKNVPPNLVYGSHTWANFAIEASRIEQQVPGALANMTFSQVMAFGSAPSASLESDDQLNEAVRLPVIGWGIANGVIKPNAGHIYTPSEFTLAFTALNKQQKELEWASKILSSPAPTREEIALAELKRVFPNIDPTLEVLERPWVKHTPVSLLDIYMTGPIDPKGWESNDKYNLPFDQISSRLAQLEPDIKTKFAEKFQTYRQSHEHAIAIQFKYQLSLLPSIEQDSIKNARIRFHELRRPYTKGKKIHLNGRLVFKPEKYSDEESETLKGRHALLMRVEKKNGGVDYYNYSPGQATLSPAEGFPNTLPENPKKQWSPNFNPAGIRLEIDDSVYYAEPKKTQKSESNVLFSRVGEISDDPEKPEDSDTLPGTYFSDKAGALGLIPGEFFTRDYDALELTAKGVTELEKGKAFDVKLKRLFLSIIPFYDGIQHAINGNVSGAIFDIGFDALGFIIPGAIAGRKAYKAGRGGFNIIKSGLIAGAGESVGIIDVHNITKNLNKAANAGYKDIQFLTKNVDDVLSRLKGNHRHYSPSQTYKENDIVKGFSLSEADALWRPTVAILKKGSWYAYNTVTKVPYGVQLLQFGALDAP